MQVNEIIIVVLLSYQNCCFQDKLSRFCCLLLCLEELKETKTPELSADYDL
jgi:hypothetical protein